MSISRSKPLPFPVIMGPTASGKTALALEIARRMDGEIISADATQTCIFLICEKKDQQAVREGLRRMNFAAPPQSDVNPAERVKAIEEEIASTQKESEEVLEKIRSYASWRDDIRFASDYFAARAEKYGVISQLLQSKRVFFLE